MGLSKFYATILILLGLCVLIGVLYLNSPYSNTTRSFSSYTLLTSSWEKYKTRFINKDGRVIDYSQGDTTTSESQSYALLQAVWIDDKTTFDLVWNWTKTNLKRPNDNLFGWRWGKRSDNSYGFLDQGGDNPASDADTDISLALILASHRWINNSYLDEAKKIIPDIWKIETDTVKGNRYLIAGNWAIGPDKIIINPSYFSPYAWRLFSKLDTQNDWNSLINPAYTLLAASGKTTLDKQNTVGLPPNWLALDKATSNLLPTNLPGLDTNYSFDAMRIPWRIAIDYQWSHDPQAKNYLDSLNFLNDYYQKNNQLSIGFTHDGQSTKDIENPAMYATSLGFFTFTQPDLAQKIYEEKIIKLYSNDTNSFQDNLPYYETNWLWFGSALYLKHITPL